MITCRLGGADASLFTINASTGVLTFVAAPNFEAPGDSGGNNVYDVTVQVSDGNGGSDTQAIAVTVTNVNEAPAISSNGGGPTAAVSAAENQAAVTTVTSTDVDGGAPTYSIAGGADASLFAINAITGALTFVTPPNFEAPGDAGANNVFDVTVRVTDGNGGTTTQAIAVAVTNANDAPAGSLAIIGTVTTGQTLTAVSSGISDADGLGAFSHQWLRNGVAVAGASGSSYVLTSADVGTLISVQLRYTDGQGTVESLTSAPTTQVANAVATPVSAPSPSPTPVADTAPQPSLPVNVPTPVGADGMAQAPAPPESAPPIPAAAGFARSGIGANNSSVQPGSTALEGAAKPVASTTPTLLLTSARSSLPWEPGAPANLSAALLAALLTEGPSFDLEPGRGRERTDRVARTPQGC